MMLRKFRQVMLIGLLTGSSIIFAPTPAAAASCYFGAVQSQSSANAYFAGGYMWNTVWYRIGYTCGGSPIEIEVRRIRAYANVTSECCGYQHEMRDQEVRQSPSGPTISHRHTNCPCWTGVGQRVEDFNLTGNILAYGSNVVVYSYCWNCSDFLAEAYCHYFRQGTKIVQGGYC